MAVGLMQRHASMRRERTSRREGRHGADELDELDELIEYGQGALTARGPAPLAIQLDTALRVAGLYVRRSEQPDSAQRSDDVRTAVALATFVARRCDETPPAALIALSSRVVAVLELCARHLPGNEAAPAQELANRMRERVDRAERLVALALDEAISSLTIARALLAHAPATDGRDAVVERARSLLARAVVAARRAGEEQLASAALASMPGVTSNADAGPEPQTRTRRASRRSTL